MSRLRRFGAALSVVVCVLGLSAVASAQDDATPPGPVRVVGSGVAAPLIETLAAEDANVTLDVTGTRAGFTALCAGEADVALANRAITADEAAACLAQGASLVELVLAYDLVAYVANPALDNVDCLATADLGTLLAPSAGGLEIVWGDVFADAPQTAATFVLPPRDSALYAALDGTVPGQGLRADVESASDDAATVDAVAASDSALGVVRLTEATSADERVKLLARTTLSPAECTLPSAEAYESGLYPDGTRLLAYTTRAALEANANLTALLTTLTSADAADAIGQAGFTAPSSTTVSTNAAALAGDVSVALPGEADLYALAPDAIGAVNVAGAAALRVALTNIADTITSQTPGVVVNVSLAGEPAAQRRLCNGEVDLIAAYGPLSEDAQANCAANSISLLTLDVGVTAATLLSHAANEYLACLTPAQIATAWRASDAPANWDQVDAAFPATPITLFAPSISNDLLDVLLTTTSDTPTLVRQGVNHNADALFRAAATANVDGALALLNWRDAQTVLNSEQANVQLVSVASGDGCVAPSDETIADGRYPLARPLTLVVSEAALQRPEVRAFLWQAYGDQQTGLLAGPNVIGLVPSALAATRSTLVAAFTAAEEAAATQAAEAEAAAQAAEAAATQDVTATETATEAATPAS